MAEKPKRVEIGFSGGQTMSARVSDDRLAAFLKDLQRGGGWYELESEDGRIALNLGQVVFVKGDTDEHRVGFSGG